LALFIINVTPAQMKSIYKITRASIFAFKTNTLKIIIQDAWNALNSAKAVMDLFQQIV
jgi:hypothetical protein